MANDQDDTVVKLGALSDERTELDTAIEEMIADMADAPPEQRATGDWAPNGAKTQAYLTLTRRQAEVEAEITALTRVMRETDNGE